MIIDSTLKAKLIYIFGIDDEAHKGCLKIGEATLDDEVLDLFQLMPNCIQLKQAAHKRIRQYTQTAGISYELFHAELAVRYKDKKLQGFNDKQVHDILRRSGIKQKSFNIGEGKASEWFEVDLNTAKLAIIAAKEGKDAIDGHLITTDQTPIILRKEQKEAIEKTKKRFLTGNKMLWNAKMRFGKTLSALQLFKELATEHPAQYKRMLILTHRPAVEDGWFEDFPKIFFEKKSTFAFGSKTKGHSFEELEKRMGVGGPSLFEEDEPVEHFVYFASMQDLRGSKCVGGPHEKNEEIFGAKWDLLVVDEAHEGTQTDLGDKVIKKLTKANTHILSLSGTAFILFQKHTEEETYHWSYVDEQKAKKEWEEQHEGDYNPYASLPKMHMFVYDLGKNFERFQDGEYSFNFHEFFRVNDNGEFRYKDSVKKFLDLMCEDAPESNYPFTKERYRNYFRHTFWLVPGVKEGAALSKMLQEHEVFGAFKVVNVCGNGDPEDVDDVELNKVRTAIADNPYTITISCGKLTTGVTVREWTGVFMLSGSAKTGAATYMQTIFRVQSPGEIEGRQKTDAYVFDFAPDRALVMLAESSKVPTRPGKATESDRKNFQEVLNFFPVIALEGSKTRNYDVESLMARLKRTYIDRVVNSGFDNNNLYNEKLLNLSDLELKSFEELKGIIGETSGTPPTTTETVNDQGLDGTETNGGDKPGKDKPTLTPEEKARRKELAKRKEQRKTAISILRGISIRMPMLIYGCDLKEGEEITIDNFAEHIDAKSWVEFMPAGVTKQRFATFLKYYDPEVFLESGRQIRRRAKEADELSVVERIRKITDIFETFKNPDKETVLTPWRVVNMHMSDTVGGYDFFELTHTEKQNEPRLVKQGAITSRVFRPTDTRILEINSKTGLYPLYVAYSTYRYRCEDWEAEGRFELDSMTKEDELAAWDDVLKNNIFVLCKTPMAASITRRTLFGFRQPEHMNVRSYVADRDLIEDLKEDNEKVARKISRPSFWNNPYIEENMKFNAVVGNPPYQMITAKKETANGQKSIVNIFQHFQQLSDLVGDCSSLIYPGGRWIHQSGKGLDKFGLSQINDPHLKRIHLYIDANELFHNVSIADGISIVLKDRSKTSNGFTYLYTDNGKTIEEFRNNPGEDIMPLNPNYSPIVRKIKDIVMCYEDVKYLSASVFPRSLFGIESDFVEKNPNKVRPYREGDLINLDNEIKVFTNDKAGKMGRAMWFVMNQSEIKTGRDLLGVSGKYKVIVSSANAGGQKRDSQIEIVDKYSAFGRSRVALKAFDTLKEAQNFLRYAKSKFIRFTFLLTDESLTSLAKWVPDICDYRDNNGLIDFSQDIDQQLISIFKLDEADVDFINKTISEIDAKRKQAPKEEEVTSTEETTLFEE